MDLSIQNLLTGPESGIFSYCLVCGPVMPIGSRLSLPGISEAILS